MIWINQFSSVLLEESYDREIYAFVLEVHAKVALALHTVWDFFRVLLKSNEHHNRGTKVAPFGLAKDH